MPTVDGRVDLPRSCSCADERDVVSALLEGGPVLAGGFVAAGLVDRVVGYVAPALLGDGRPALQGRARERSPRRTGSDSMTSPAPATTCASSRSSRGADVFTGIVEELGEVVAVEELQDAARLTVRGPVVTTDAGHGDSIAVNGVCLTVVDTTTAPSPPTSWPRRCAARSLGGLSVGSPVNLERAVQVSRPARRPRRAGPRRRHRPVVSVTPDEHWTVVRLALPDGARPLRRREGLDHGRRGVA